MTETLRKASVLLQEEQGNDTVSAIWEYWKDRSRGHVSSREQRW